ncbi:hypothetical protein EHS13_31890 [Paenibacillus psychroresistens]|uniref:Uncharacterized protein n=1 Tax=Paenibacillus psychroresistens TaxID=1778678 RepID=A0A6B8RRX4_9BACL|nr:hypothetical protein [Paenibacillus psychroresistens]QGQ99151.1 hypothetical protein EHS13_31890 [Paenibacillus psychroresistens]
MNPIIVIIICLIFVGLLLVLQHLLFAFWDRKIDNVKIGQYEKLEFPCSKIGFYILSSFLVIFGLIFLYNLILLEWSFIVLGFTILFLGSSAFVLYYPFSRKIVLTDTEVFYQVRGRIIWKVQFSNIKRLVVIHYNNLSVIHDKDNKEYKIGHLYKKQWLLLGIINSKVKMNV